MRLHTKIALLIAVIVLLQGGLIIYWDKLNHQESLQTQAVQRGTGLWQAFADDNAQLLANHDFTALAVKMADWCRREAELEYLYLTNSQGRLLAHSSGDGQPEFLKTIAIHISRNEPVYRVGDTDVAMYEVSLPVKELPGSVAHLGVKSIAPLPPQPLVLMIVTAALGVVIGWALTGRFTQPVVSLAEHFRHYGQGRDIPAGALELPGGGHEARVLAEAFKQMLNDRKKVEHELSCREAEFAAMINSMTDAVMFADVARTIRMCNPAAEKLFGYGSDELLGNSSRMLYAEPTDFDTQGQLRYRTGDGAQIEPYEMRYKRKDGAIIHCETRGMQVKDEQGNLIGFIGMFRDISVERRQREELNQFKNTLDDTLDCVFMFRPDTLNFFYVNKGAIEQVGYSEDEMLDMTPVDIKPDYDEPRFRALLKPLLDGTRQSITFETVHAHKNGRRVPVEIFLQYIAPADEQPRFVAMVRDLTERKRAEKVLHERHQLLMLIINNAPLVLFVIDKEGIFKLSLGKGLQHLGLEPGQVVGQSALELYADNPQIIEDIKRSLQGEHVVSYTEISQRCYEVYYSPFYDSEGASAGTVGVAVDITERRQAELELRKHRDSLEELVAQRTHELAAANKELEAFSYSVSHDLRAPLRSIDGFSHILLDEYSEGLDGTAKDYLQRIRTAAQRMAQLIDDLLELARVTRGELFVEPVDITSMANAIVKELRAASPERQANITIDPKLKAQGDMSLLHVMLQNLLTNAWKYTSKRQVAEIKLGRLDPEQNVFYIRDNGAGFDMRYAKKLFGAFQRLHGTDEFEGTGIGLATVQRIIQRHGGKVWGESEVDKGATFYFQLPASAGSETVH